jgi:hypothetical protein
LPLPSLLRQRLSSLVVGAASIDSSGRIADRVVLRAAGYQVGDRLDIRAVDAGIEVLPAPEGASCVSRQGFVFLPARARRTWALRTGDRVVLVAEPGRGRLLVVPPVALEDLLVGLSTSRPGDLA